MWAGILAVIKLVGNALGLFQSQADANAAAVHEQDGADATTAASLEAQNKIQAKQTAAVVNAPPDVAGVIAAADKGEL